MAENIQKPRTPNITEEYSSKRIYVREDVLTATSALQLQADEILSYPIKWATYQQIQHMSQQETDFMVKLDSPEGKTKIPETAGEHCSEVLISLLNKLNKDNLLEYLLALIDDILSEDKTRVDLFRSSSSLRAFLNKLTSDNLFVEHMSARIIAKLACWHRNHLDREDLTAYLTWIKRRLKAEMSVDGRSEYINSVVRCLQMMLRIDAYRYAFVQMKGISLLLDLLSSKVNFQIQYQVVFCLWVLTFNPNLAENVTHYPHFIPLLSEILTVSGKEKVTRIVLALFRNLIEKPKDAQIIKQHCTALVQNKVMKQLMIVDLKGSDDEDFMNDMELLINRLQASMKTLSSLDQYAAEVKSGRLEWSTVHKSAQFWRENAPKIHEDQGLLHAIVKLLGSQDPIVLAVACYDIGEYVRHYPRGKIDIEQLGGKHRVMALLVHKDPNVRYEALLAVQKLMVFNWEYLGRQLEKDKSEDKKTKKTSLTKEAAGSKTKQHGSSNQNLEK